MFIDQIVAAKRREIEERKKIFSVEKLKEMVLAQPAPTDFASALRGENISLIAEVKKASPSRGIIRADFNPVAIANTYAANGAAAISVLTDSTYFQGSLEYMNNIRKALGSKGLPILRKDFILEPYQIYESRAYGADAVLLIVALLTPDTLATMLQASHEIGMNCLVEVHNEAELETALVSQAKIIGINNRDLATFDVDTTTTKRLRPLIPQGKIVVSESGIKERRDIEKLKSIGVDAVLVGESLMAAPDIAAKMQELF